ncbi:MAG: hypothetical protein ABSD57_14885 [Verrucomicrobiota bacterium]|jgi:hypothetical protein
MHLKEAREKGKLNQFASEHEKKYPPASKKHFHAVLKSMALGTAQVE